MKKQRPRFQILLGLWLAMAIIYPVQARGHCDTMDGPVVKAAQKALETGDVNLVLIWVQSNDEAAIRDAFDKTLAVRKLGAGAKALADMYFFETLVRIHRAGEGAPYTGIEPAGTVVEPGISAADKAVDTGSAEELIKRLTETASDGVLSLFKDLQAKKNYNEDDVKSGREYVESYVVFIHYVERLFSDAEKIPEEHAGKAEDVPVHHEH